MKLSDEERHAVLHALIGARVRRMFGPGTEPLDVIGRNLLAGVRLDHFLVSIGLDGDSLDTLTLGELVPAYWYYRSASAVSPARTSAPHAGACETAHASGTPRRRRSRTAAES